MPYKTTELQRAYSRNHYNTHKEQYKSKHRAWLDNQQRLKQEILMSLGGCKNCGESDYRCLDFHHTDPSTKDAEVSELWRHASIITIRKEIEKCEVLCANCHRKLHYK